MGPCIVRDFIRESSGSGLAVIGRRLGTPSHPHPAPHPPTPHAAPMPPQPRRPGHHAHPPRSRQRARDRLGTGEHVDAAGVLGTLMSVAERGITTSKDPWAARLIPLVRFRRLRGGWALKQDQQQLPFVPIRIAPAIHAAPEASHMRCAGTAAEPDVSR